MQRVKRASAGRPVSMGCRWGVVGGELDSQLLAPYNAQSLRLEEGSDGAGKGRSSPQFHQHLELPLPSASTCLTRKRMGGRLA